MRTGLRVLVLSLLGCGRTALGPEAVDAGVVIRPPVVACAQGGASPRLLVTAAEPVISSLVVEGDDLYVASHKAFLPMLYRLRGQLERFSRCGGGAVVLSADEDRPGSLAVSGDWVHWRAADHDSGGTNTQGHVKSRERLGTRVIDRSLDASAALSAVVLERGVLRWLETTSGTVTLRASEEPREALQAETSFRTPEGSWSLLPAGGGALALLRKHALGLEASRSEPASARVSPLWSTSDRPDLFAAAGDTLFYVTWDPGRMQRVIKRHPLTALATATIVDELGTRLPTALLHTNGELYFADADSVTRLTLATGARRTWPLELNSTDGEQVSALASADGRLYLARSWTYSGQATAGTVWVIDLP